MKIDCCSSIFMLRTVLYYIPLAPRLGVTYKLADESIVSSVLTMADHCEDEKLKLQMISESMERSKSRYIPYYDMDHFRAGTAMRLAINTIVAIGVDAYNLSGPEITVFPAAILTLVAAGLNVPSDNSYKLFEACKDLQLAILRKK